MYKIATLNKISPVGLGRLTDEYTVVESTDDANGILVRSQAMHDMDFSKNLLAIGRAGAGVNNIPLDRCAAEGIAVFNTPGANANAVKELVLSGLLLSARNIPDALAWSSTLTDNVGKTVEKGKSQFAGRELKGKTLGIIGLGAIGVLVANAAELLGMDVIGYDPFLTVKAAHDLSNTIHVVDGLKDLLPQCDYISIHVPAVADTKGMINNETIGQMKDGAVFLNFSRDTLVNDGDMLAALKSGKLKKYVTDFPNDTVIGKEGVVALPHLGASSAEAEDNCASMAVDQIMDYIENGNIVNSVNLPACDLGPIGSAPRVCIIHKNTEGLLGRITGAFTDLGINMENMMNKTRGDFAYALVELAGSIDEDKIRKKLNMNEIISLRVIG
ncbi:MAG: 3-phosphoglycerate dehydrogenase family protein [Anaerovoracaceae bacterium]